MVRRSSQLMELNGWVSPQMLARYEASALRECCLSA